MIIFYGEKEVRKKMGRVASFCPICRDIKPFNLVRVGLTTHIYYVSFGEGKLSGYEISCEDCKSWRWAEIEEFEGGSKDPTDDLESLIQETNPRLFEKNFDRLELEVKMRSDNLSEEERDELLEEPFTAVNPQIEKRSIHFDVYSGGTLAGTLGAFIFFFNLGAANPLDENLYFYIALSFLILGAIIFLYFVITEKRRFVRAKLYPLLIKALKPLDPSKEEITEAILQMKQQELKIGKYTNPDQLFADLSEDIHSSSDLPWFFNRMPQRPSDSNIETNNDINGDDQKDREDHLLQIFIQSNETVDERKQKTHFDKQSGLGCAGTILFFFGGFFGALLINGNSAGTIASIGISISFLLFLFTLISLAGDAKRHIRNKILPGLLIELIAFDPKLEELEKAVERLNKRELVLGRYLQANKIYQMVQAAKGNENV